MVNILPARLVLFDGVCNLCNGSVQFIIRHDPKETFSFASLQSDTGQRVLGDLGLSPTDMNSFVYVRDGKAYRRSTAALMVAKDIGGFISLLYAFMLVPRPLRDMVYDLIARYRYRWFGKRDSCMVPTAALKSRFL